MSESRPRGRARRSSGQPCEKRDRSDIPPAPVERLTPVCAAGESPGPEEHDAYEGANNKEQAKQELPRASEVFAEIDQVAPVIAHDAHAVVMGRTAAADVDDSRVGHVDDPPPFLSQPRAEVGLFEIEEVGLIQQKGPDRVPAYQKAGTLQAVDIMARAGVFVEAAVASEDPRARERPVEEERLCKLVPERRRRDSRALQAPVRVQDPRADRTGVGV